MSKAKGWLYRTTNVKHLKLDLHNPRLPKYVKQHKDEDVIRAYLIDKAEVMRIARSISNNGYHKTATSIVIGQGRDFVVLDGNRRLAACQLLLNPSLALNSRHQKELKELAQNLNINELKKIRIAVAPSRKEANKEIWDIHVSKLLRPWERLERLRMYGELIETGEYTVPAAAAAYNVSLGTFKVELETLFFYEKIAEATELDEDDANLRKTFNMIERILLSSNGKKILGYSIDEKGSVKLEDEKRFEAVFKDLLPYVSGSNKLPAQITQDELVDEVYSIIDPQNFRSQKLKKRPTKTSRKSSRTTQSSKVNDQNDGNFPLKVVNGDEKIFNIKTTAEAIIIVRALASRFHAVASKLKNAQRRSKPPFLLADEYDVQYLFEAVLEVFFKDVRPEEWTPSYLGKSTRVDFLLPDFKIVIEIKFINDRLTDKELHNQLIEDIVHYNAMPSCKTLVCFIYNPNSKLKNPNAIKADLEKSIVTDIDSVITLIEPH